MTVRLSGEDPAQKHIVDLSVGIRTAIAGYQNPIIEVEALLAEGGEDDAAGMRTPASTSGFDRALRDCRMVWRSVPPAKAADTMLGGTTGSPLIGATCRVGLRAARTAGPWKSPAFGQ